ncbi:MAG: hypothetical protein KAR25_00850, partial [Methanosarcinales archaeon]|nr:hypothetical protein [Methanosarcinales archaeon]
TPNPMQNLYNAVIHKTFHTNVKFSKNRRRNFKKHHNEIIAPAYSCPIPQRLLNQIVKDITGGSPPHVSL